MGCQKEAEGEALTWEAVGESLGLPGAEEGETAGVLEGAMAVWVGASTEGVGVGVAAPCRLGEALAESESPPPPHYHRCGRGRP